MSTETETGRGSQIHAGTMKPAAAMAAREASLKAAQEREAARPPAPPPAAQSPLRDRSRFSETGHQLRQWVATLPSATLYEEVLQPAYWRPVATQLRLGDEIIVRPDSLAWWAKLVVIGSDHVRALAEVAPLSHVTLPQPEMANSSTGSAYKIEGRGLTEKFCVVRISDNHTIKIGLPSEADARSFISSNLIPRNSVGEVMPPLNGRGEFDAT